jgi:hypothetical protein
MGDMMMKSSFRPIDRNLSVASICGPSDGVAVFQTAFGANCLRRYGKGGDQPYKKQHLVHDAFLL